MGPTRVLELFDRLGVIIRNDHHGIMACGSLSTVRARHSSQYQIRPWQRIS